VRQECLDTRRGWYDILWRKFKAWKGKGRKVFSLRIASFFRGGGLKTQGVVEELAE